MTKDLSGLKIDGVINLMSHLPCFAARPAAKILSNLEVAVVDTIKVKYTFDRSSKSVPTTSCAKLSSKQTTTIFITPDFDWFDVATALGGLILQRNQLEDAFFISSIMEASLQTLRHRGFPVDRVLKPGKSDLPAPIYFVLRSPSH